MFIRTDSIRWNVVSSLLTVAFVLTLASTEQSSAQEKPKSKPKDAQAAINAEVKSLLRAKNWIVVGGRLEELGAQGYDAYTELLDDPKASERSISRIYYLLSEQRGDRSQFKKYAVRDLSRPEDLLRSNVIAFLGTVGGREDAKLLVPLLADEQGLVQSEAAKALSRIGDARQLQTLELRMEIVAKSGDPDTYKAMKIARDAWKIRLEKEMK